MVGQDQRARFEELLQPVHEAAIRYCRRLCTTRQDAEDLYHDAILTAWHGLPGLRNTQDGFKPWFFRIITNTFRNQLRRRRWRQLWLGKRTGDQGDDGMIAAGSAASSDPRGALDARRWLDRAMAGLAAEERALIVLHELEGYGTAEIARIWGVREGTIKSRLSRARKKMRQTVVRSLAASQATVDAGGKVYYAMQPNQTTSE
jgi:RNA polymerase sigma-70 factor (ECF subfamily)